MLGASDPEVLAFCAREGRVLIPHDRDSMPGHVKRFVETATSTGIVMVSQKMDLGDAIKEIIMIWSATDREEWLNRILYLPL